MTYSVLKTDGRIRLVHTQDDEARVVTTIGDLDAAKAIAQTLTSATSELAKGLIYQLAEPAGIEKLTETIPNNTYDEVSGIDVHPKPVDTSRRILAIFDAPERDHGLRDWSVEKLSAITSDQPASVRRAVRDELAAAYRPYDGIPVLAIGYDYKYLDYCSDFLLNPVLTVQTAEAILEESRRGSDSTLRELMYEVVIGGHANLSELDSTAETGYLAVTTHPALVRAWLDQNR